MQSHDNHPGGNSLFKGAVIVGHENLWDDMQWIIRRQMEPDFKRRDLDRAAQLMANLRAHLPEIGEETELKDIHRFLAVLDGLLAEGVKIDHVVRSRSPPLLRSDLPPCGTTTRGCSRRSGRPGRKG